ncbi:MAG: histidine kinase [Bacteroidota bacterium]
MNRNLRRELWRHLLFWIVVFFFEVSRSRLTFVNYSLQSFNQDFMETLLNLPVLLLASYFTTYYLIPKYFNTSRYLKFSLLIALSAIVFILCMRIILRYITLPIWYPDYVRQYPDFFHFNIFQHFFYIYSVVLFMVLMQMIQQYEDALRKKEQLEKQKVDAELSLLRSQVNPHFLYNTLNNINTLSRIDAEKTSESIIQLSEIMRYMIRDSSTETVLLESEIGFIKSYIRLQMLRISDPGFVEFKIQGDAGGWMIPPMLLIPFIENAFKHSRKDVTPPGIKILLRIGKNRLDFSVENFTRKSPASIDTGSTGAGIENVKKRLQMLFPSNHSLATDESQEKFRVHLSLDSNG